MPEKPSSSAGARPANAFSEEGRRLAFIWLPHMRSDAEMHRQPSLRGREFAVVAGLNSRAAVLDGRGEGVRGVTEAGRLPEHVLRIPFRPALCEHWQQQVVAFLQSISWTVRVRDTGEFFVQLPARKDRSEELALERICRYLRRERFSFRIGVADSPLGAYMSARLAAPERLFIADGEEQLIARQSIFMLPDVPDSILRRLYGVYNIRTVAALATLPPGRLQAVFGRWGELLYRLGRLRWPLPPPLERSDYLSSCDFSTFRSDEAADNTLVRSRIYALLADMAGRLRSDGRAARSCRLVVDYTDRFRREYTLRFKESSCDEQDLFNLLRPRLDEALARRVALARITLDFPRLAPRDTQQSLFEPPTRRSYMMNTMDSIRRRYGNSMLRSGREIEGQARRAGGGSGVGRKGAPPARHLGGPGGA